MPDRRQGLERLAYQITSEFGGSISAEHGIGIVKRPYLKMSRTSEEIETMRTLKRALDPNNILNPGRIFTAWEDAWGGAGILVGTVRYLRLLGKWRPNTFHCPTVAVYGFDTYEKIAEARAPPEPIA
jgi:FAD linked oxidases, C-terminal domain